MFIDDRQVNDGSSFRSELLKSHWRRDRHYAPKGAMERL
jgi:hypothetical protein